MLEKETTELKPLAVSLGEKAALDIEPEKTMTGKLTASNIEDLNVFASGIGETFVTTKISKIFTSDKFTLGNPEYYCYITVLPLRRKNRQ
jgi:hypothetical protein